jgi:hypothetical protein
VNITTTPGSYIKATWTAEVRAACIVQVGCELACSCFWILGQGIACTVLSLNVNILLCVLPLPTANRFAAVQRRIDALPPSQRVVPLKTRPKRNHKIRLVALILALSLLPDLRDDHGAQTRLISSSTSVIRSFSSEATREDSRALFYLPRLPRNPRSFRSRSGLYRAVHTYVPRSTVSQESVPLPRDRYCVRVSTAKFRLAAPIENPDPTGLTSALRMKKVPRSVG